MKFTHDSDNIMADDQKVFNTRLEEETIEKIRAYAWHRRTTIQAVTQAALNDFFEAREKESETALKAYKNKDNPL